MIINVHPASCRIILTLYSSTCSHSLLAWMEMPKHVHVQPLPVEPVKVASASVTCQFQLRPKWNLGRCSQVFFPQTASALNSPQSASCILEYFVFPLFTLMTLSSVFLAFLTSLPPSEWILLVYFLFVRIISSPASSSTIPFFFSCEVPILMVECGCASILKSDMQARLCVCACVCALFLSYAWAQFAYWLKELLEAQMCLHCESVNSCENPFFCFGSLFPSTSPSH